MRCMLLFELCPKEGRQMEGFYKKKKEILGSVILEFLIYF